MVELECKSCGKPACRWTIFGMYLGDYCNRCYRDVHVRVMQTMEPFRRQIRDGFERYVEAESRNPECDPEERPNTCWECGDPLIGHEDESRTRCRGCVTGQPQDAPTAAQTQ